MNLTMIAENINRLHDLAMMRAGEAIDHAREAGKLLLETRPPCRALAERKAALGDGFRI